MKNRGSDAKGFYDGSGFTVLKGSVIAKDSTPSLSWKGRDSIVRELTKEDGGKFVLEYDKTFSSPSTAAAFCMGRNTNGWEYWKDGKGQSLDTVYRKPLENK